MAAEEEISKATQQTPRLAMPDLNLTQFEFIKLIIGIRCTLLLNKLYLHVWGHGCAPKCVVYIQIENIRLICQE